MLCVGEVRHIPGSAYAIPDLDQLSIPPRISAILSGSARPSCARA
jgi:hypothetical protein